MANTDLRDLLKKKDTVAGDVISQMWEDTTKLYPHSRNRIDHCRKLRNGDIRVPLPEGWADEATQEMVTADLPHKRNLVIREVNLLAQTRPIIRRWSANMSWESGGEADDFETWINSYVKQVDPWLLRCGKLTEDGEHGLAVLPSTAHFYQAPNYMETIDRDQYAKLDKKEQASYSEDEEGGKTVFKRPRSKHWRDARGRDSGDENFTKRDERKTRKAWEDARLDFLAQKPPGQVHVFSATDCLPILGPCLDGEGYTTEGLLVRTLFDRNDLIRRKYRWDGMHDLISPTSWDSKDNYGCGGQIYLYSFFISDENGDPHIVYSVGGKSTWLEDSDHDVVINLAEEYGIRELPVRYSYGMHYADDNPDMRGVPIMWPLARAILNLEGLITAQLIYARRVGFPSYLIKPDPDAPIESYMDGDSPRVIQEPQGGGGIIYPGTIQNLQAQRVSNDVQALTAFFQSTIDDTLPSEAVYGGAGATSGHDRVLAQQYLLAARHMIRRSLLNDTRWIAEQLTGHALLLMERDRIEVPIYENVEKPQTETGKLPKKAKPVVLREAWVGEVCKVRAEYPKEQADLASIQLYNNLLGNGSIGYPRFAHLLGIESWQMELVDAYNWRRINTPEGMAEIAELSAKLRADEEDLELMELVNQGVMTEGGVPTAALVAQQPQGVEQGQQPGMGMEHPDMYQHPEMGQGLTVPNIAANQLGGQVSGGVQQATAVNDAQAAAGITPEFGA